MYTSLADVPAVVVASKPAVTPEALRAAGTRTPALLPIANRPLAAHALATLARAGVRHVVVTGEGSRCDTVRERLMGERPEGVELVFHEEALGGAVLRAREHGAGSALILHSAEYLFRDDFARLVSRVREESLDALVVTERMSEQPADSFGPPGRRFRRPRLSGVQVLGRTSGDLAAELDQDNGLETTFEHLAERLRERGRAVQTTEVEHGWRFGAGALEALLEGNRVALDDGIRRDVPDGVLEGRGTRIEGRVEVHPTARIADGSVVRGPAVIGAGALIALGSFVGPYTSVGAGAVIRASQVENSVILDDAKIDGLGDKRLEGSIVGRGAEILRRFGTPSGLHVVVAGGARVVLD
jgi:glucose-1-phosphate thymidylyltransferase